MILTGQLRMRDQKGTIRFHKNGECIHTMGDSNIRMSYLEAKQLVERHGCEKMSKQYLIDGEFVAYLRFLDKLNEVMPREARIKDEDYVEQHIEHIPVEERHKKAYEPTPEDQVPQDEEYWK